MPACDLLPVIDNETPSCPLPVTKRPFSLPVATTLAVMQALVAVVLFIYARGGDSASERAGLEEVRKHGTELAKTEAAKNSARYEELIQRMARVEEAVSRTTDGQKRIEARLDDLIVMRRASISVRQIPADGCLSPVFPAPRLLALAPAMGCRSNEGE